MSRTLSRQELLFGLLAVKSGRVARSDLRQLCDEREATPEVGLVELLIRKGVLSTEACEVLRHQVEELTAGSAGAGSTTVAHVTALDEELAELSRDLTSAAGPGLRMPGACRPRSSVRRRSWWAVPMSVLRSIRRRMRVHLTRHIPCGRGVSGGEPDGFEF